MDNDKLPYSLYILIFLFFGYFIYNHKKQMDEIDARIEWYNNKHKKPYTLPVTTQRVIGVVESSYPVSLSKYLRRYRVNLQNGSSFLIGGNFSMPYFQRGDNVVGVYEDNNLEYIIDSRGNKYNP